MNESKAEKSSILIFPEKPDYPSHTKEMKRKERSSSSARSNPRSLLKKKKTSHGGSGSVIKSFSKKIGQR